MKEMQERWSIHEVAKYLGLSHRHTREQVVVKPTFPKPIIKISQKTRFWGNQDVMKWAAKGG